MSPTRKFVQSPFFCVQPAPEADNARKEDVPDQVLYAEEPPSPPLAVAATLLNRAMALTEAEAGITDKQRIGKKKPIQDLAILYGLFNF